MAEITITDATFDTKVLKSPVGVLVDFWAIWCTPCRMQDPILEEIEKELGEKIIIAKLNVDENPATASKYGVMSIPTLILFKGGVVLKQMIGVQSKETLLEEIKKVTA